MTHLMAAVECRNGLNCYGRWRVVKMMELQQFGLVFFLFVFTKAKHFARQAGRLFQWIAN